MLTSELSALSLFEGLTQDQLTKLAPIFWRVSLAAGETIFYQHDAARFVYVVETGEVILRFYPDDGGSVDIETLTPGAMFGWSSALGRPHYTSAAICKTPVKAVVTHGADLRRVMRGDKALSGILIERMANVVAHRLDSFREQLNKLLATEEAEA